jgi:hypothetical protein
MQRPADDLFGIVPAAHDSISVAFLSGDAIVYAATVDLARGDTSYQFVPPAGSK